jgi:hypothetical protein
VEKWYDVFGRRFVVRSRRRDVMSLVGSAEAAWSRLACGPAQRADVEIDVLVEAGAPGSLREVQAFANETFFLNASRHRLITGHRAGRRWQVHVQSALDDAFRIVHAMVVPTFLDLIERRGLSTLHAAAVACRGRGVLLCGETGSGKSTSALALVAGGFDFLTDNDAYLDLVRGRPRVRSRGGTVALREPSARLIPGLPALGRFPLRGRGRHRKRQVEVHAVRPGARVESAPVRLLLFPWVGAGRNVRFRPLSRTDALARLLASYPLGGSTRGVVHDEWAQGQRFRRLSELVAAAPAYAVSLGPDLEGFAERVRALLR